jgi:RNA polymerase sigma-70 factor (ECF subfamily)
MKYLNDFEIIESVKRGNQSDFSLLVDRYKDRAFSMLRRMLKNELDAEEALQDCFMKAYNGLKEFRKDSQFSTWFYKITFNTALSIISSQKRKHEQEMTSIDDEFDIGKFDPEIYSSTENPAQYINKMVDKLPVRNALVLILFYLDGLSLNDISQVMNISLVNVKVLLHRSRNSLRDLLLKHNYQEELL